MRKLSFFLLILLLSVSTSWASKVSQDESLKIAQQVAQNHTSRYSRVLELVHTETTNGRVRGREIVNYYVYNIGKGDGFVIVAGDNIEYPVIGYSHTSMYDNDNLPPAFKAWMENVKSNMNLKIEQKIKPSERTTKAWDKYLNESVEIRSGGVHLMSTKWGQQAPFNIMCPAYGNGSQSLVGCVATAMAQIMKFHNHPSTGTGSTEPYVTRRHNINIPAIPLTEPYKWDHMLPNYYSATEEQKNAVATLMYHCAATLQMDFSRDESLSYSSDVPAALVKYFDYDASVMVYERDLFEEQEWVNLLKKEIDSLRPVLYAGFNSSYGHAFVCDGYDSNNLFHFNWGWAGSFDGFYNIQDVHGFKHGNLAVVGIKKNEGGSPMYNIQLPERDLTATKTELPDLQSSRILYVNTGIINTGLGHFNGKLAVYLADMEDNIVASISNNQMVNLNPGEVKFLDNIQCRVRVDPKPGQYKIVIGAWTKSEPSDFRILKTTKKYKSELPLKIGTLVTSVSLNQNNFSMESSATLKLIATILPDNATLKTVSWSTSNPSVATVDTDGLVTAIEEGFATITVTTADGCFYTTCEVEVRNTSTATEDLKTSKIAFWANNKGLNVYLPERKAVQIVGLDGSVIYQSELSVGDSFIQLEEGVYFFVIDNTTSKIYVR